MTTIPVKVLLIEDDEDDALLTREYLAEIENFSFEVEWEPNLKLARKKMMEGNYEIFLVDYRLGHETGLHLVKFIRDQGVLTPSIVLTGQGDLRVDIDASSYGASDYLIKTELNASILERSIRYALSHFKILRELEEKEKKYRSLFERSIDPIFLATDKLKLMNVNQSFLSFFGYTTEACRSITLNSIFTNEEDFIYFKTTLMATEQVKDFEVSLKTKTGDDKICFLNCVFIPDQASDFCCYQGIIHDLTHRKQAEHDMLNAERLSVTGKIARTMAHEVRNPLTNLNLALSQLRNEIPAGNESATLYGDIIERNANRIELLVDEMLNVSKHKELHLQLTTITELIHDTLALARDRLNLRQIQLITHCPNDLPRILVDKSKIQVALLNIIINAIEAMQPGVGLLKIEATLDGTVVRLSIEDNGKGIKAKDLGKLFDPFFTDKQNGMGLGLTSTKNILNSHNATIEVKSEWQKGTVFYINFKLSE